MQSGVADSSLIEERPKYLGRIMATLGIGFVLGPALSAFLPMLSTRSKIRFSALLPLLGLFIALFFAKETKNELYPCKNVEENSNKKNIPRIDIVLAENPDRLSSSTSFEVGLLVLNGFLLMYAFSTETIYAMFIKDSFGYGERALSALFACNGLFIGIFQIFFIKPLIGTIGKHATLALGDALLALGMIGIAFVRNEKMHFALFTVHIVGYSIADTALVSLISRYSSQSSQGRDLSFNQAAQACARVLSPVVAGFLYEQSKQKGALPIGALPFLLGGIFPAIGIMIPLVLLYFQRTK
jgi:Na+/melibiose symporter-like transporter